MKSISYLMVTQAKNSLKNLLHHPLKLLSYLFVIALIGMSVFFRKDSAEAITITDSQMIQGIYFFVLLGLMVMIIISGLKSGSTFFNMPDVNLLFVSPLRPNLILAYGLVKQMSSLLLMIVFLMLYSPMLMNLFALTPGQVFVMIVGLAVLLVLSQILSMLLYNVINGSPSRRKILSYVIYAVTALPAIYIAAIALLSQDVYHAALQAAASPLLNGFPVAGWFRGAIFGLILGDEGQAVLYTALLVVLAVVSVIILVKGNPDYYEDVLQSTEKVYTMQQAKKENDNIGLSVVRNRGAVKKAAFRGGWGSSTLFYKHLFEMRRRNRLGFLTTSTLLILLIAMGMALFIERTARGDGEPRHAETMFATILSTEIYLLYFFQISADWVNELKKPYIYLIPTSSLSRLVWASATTLIKPLFDAAITFTILGLYLQVNPIIILSGIIMYTSFAWLFTATSILFFRLFGQPAVKGLLAFLQLICLVVLAIPGGIVAWIAMILLDLPWYFAGVGFAVGSILVTLGVYIACHNILEAPEMQ